MFTGEKRMMPADTETLQMSGLSPATEEACRTIYNGFLKDHDLESCPVKITITQASQQYQLEIICGQFGVEHVGSLKLTSTPEAGIGEQLRRMMEFQYEYHQALAQPKGRR
jgi:hypothetical protein